MERFTRRFFYFAILLFAVFQSACSTQNVKSKIQATGVRGALGVSGTFGPGDEISFIFTDSFNVAGVRGANALSDGTPVSVFFVSANGKTRRESSGSLKETVLHALVAEELVTGKYRLVFGFGNAYYVAKKSDGSFLEVDVLNDEDDDEGDTSGTSATSATSGTSVTSSSSATSASSATNSSGGNSSSAVITSVTYQQGNTYEARGTGFVPSGTTFHCSVNGGINYSLCGAATSTTTGSLQVTCSMMVQFQVRPVTGNVTGPSFSATCSSGGSFGM